MHPSQDHETVEGSAADWVADRVPSAVVHLDAAAAGRPSAGTLRAQTAHLQAEADRGGYVAEAEAEADGATGRAALGALLGLASSDVAFTGDGAAAFAVLLAAWPLRRGDRVGTVPSEYGGNARVLERLAAERGWQLVTLPVDALGRVREVPAGLALLTLPQVASQRGVVQPVAELLASGVPLLLDVAQSLGQSAVPAGCAAYVGTSRKWLCGPRGVGFAVVDPAWEPELGDPPTLTPSMQDGVRRLESSEAHVAGRVGLGVAVTQWTPELLPLIHAGAARARALLGVAGWSVVEPVQEATGLTTLVPPPGVDPVQVRAALLARGLLVSAVPQARAADLAGPLLRVSTAAWSTEQDVTVLADLLQELTPSVRQHAAGLA